MRVYRHLDHSTPSQHRDGRGATWLYAAAWLLPLAIWLAGCSTNRPTQFTVLINSVSGQPRLQPGSVAQMVFTTPSTFSGSVDPTQTQITFVDSSGNKQTSTATSQSAAGQQITLVFTVPAVTPAAATTYQVSLQGKTTQGQSFQGESVSATVYPAASIASLLPASGRQGQTVSVAITAANTDFAQGQTQATFGTGIAVNGAAAGLPGLITVTGTGAASAMLVIDPAATVGTRNVTVTTGGQTAVLGSAFTVQAALVPLTASAGGPYTGYSGQGVQFDGSKSADPNGVALTYAWTFGDGGAAATAQPSHSYAKAGTYTVQLTVSDANGLSATSSTTATITTLTNPIAAAGGPYNGTTGQAISFSGAGSSDPNGSTLTYAWAFGDGSTGSGAAPTHTYSKAGTYTATLTVTDTLNLTGTAMATVTVSDPLKSPVANAGGPYAGTTGTAVTFSGAGSSDPQGQTLGYVWDFGDGVTGSGVSPTHSYAAAGTYTVKLTVTNASGLTATASTTATISSTAQAPIANAGGPYTGTAGAALAFSGAGSSDPQGQALGYAWDFGDGTTGTGVAPTHPYAAAGIFTVKLTVTDTSSLSASASTTATIAAAPTNSLTANAGGAYTGTVNNAVTFSGTGSSDPKGEALTYAWDFGDGNTGTGVAPTHAYNASGTYTVTLTVTNTDGATASATAIATINTVLLSVQTGPYTGNVSQVLSFDGTNSTAPGMDSLTYAWTFGDGGNGAGAQTTHTYTTACTCTVTLTVTDTTTNLSANSTATATITAPPQITITAPAQGAVFNTTSVTVSGTTGSNVQSVAVNGVTATLSSGSFTASVPVRAGVNILTATGTDSKGNVGTASSSITIDLSPPSVSILQPANNATVTTQQISVSGMVTDQVTGTVNGNNVTVTVNGQAATVSNRSFMVNSLLLVPGSNTLNVVATDAAGNSTQTTAKVTYANPAAQQHIVVLSGDGQSGQINAVLPQPLVVQLVSGTGTPVAGRTVTFTVTASDGTVESLPLQAQTLNLTTDTQGKASVLFQLGSRAGVGINQVSVSSPGFMGGAVFTATTTPGAPAFVHEFLGNNQRGIIGQSLAQGFQVVVQDAGGDPIANVPVTYTVNTGDGLFAGQAATTVMTNSDGRAIATLTLGQQEGINNNTVTADFANDPNAPVQFYASGFSSGDPAKTQVSGVVLDNAGNAVPNATARLLNTTLSTTTDANGHFSLSPVPVGTTTLLIDGSTTTLNETLPQLSFLLQALPGQNNSLNMPVYLPIIDTQSARTAGGNVPATLTMAGMPGVALTVAPNSVTFPDGSHVGQLTLSQVKSDLIPMPPPNGIPPAFAWTIQPAGTIFSTPVTITIPNTQGLPPGQVQEFYQYDHDLEQFVSVGTLRVSPDGSVLNSDPGFGITKAGWSGPGSSPPPGGCGQSCNDNNVCTTDAPSGKCGCTHTPKNGGCGGNPPAGANNCQQPGQCVNGTCSNKPKAPGSGCNDNMFCTSDDVCGLDGVCRGTAKPPQSVPFSGFALQQNLETVTDLVKPLIQKYFGSDASNGFNVTIGASGQEQMICCESKKDFEQDQNGTYTFQGGITSPPVFLSFPPWSLPFGLNGGGYGLSATMGIQFGSQITTDITKCQDYMCAQGAASITGGITLQLGATVNDPTTGLTIASLQLQAPAMLNTTIQTSADCKSVDYSIGLNAITLTFVAQLGTGFQATFPFWTPVGAVTLTSGSKPLQ